MGCSGQLCNRVLATHTILTREAEWHLFLCCDRLPCYRFTRFCSVAGVRKHTQTHTKRHKSNGICIKSFSFIFQCHSLRFGIINFMSVTFSLKRVWFFELISLLPTKWTRFALVVHSFVPFRSVPFHFACALLNFSSASSEFSIAFRCGAANPFDTAK